MTEIVHTFTAWMVAHTYAVVFVATLIDATAIPFPGRVLLAFAGALAATGEVSAIVVIALGAAGVVVTDHLWYFAGALGGDRLLRLYCRLTFSPPDCVQRTTDWFTRFGRLTIVVGRFVAAVRVLAWPLAREHGVGYLTFLAFDVTAALAWTATWVGLGWFLGDRWAQASAEARWLGVVLALAAIVVLASVRLWRRYHRAATT